ncbi:MAG TPA: hypothetical protein DDY68_06265 [Porphyromonadaceae bacterium]|nr:hypothetical protein [Porphyromonadaceae bacterium]
MISMKEDKKGERTSLWKLFLLGIMGGIFALITPCVWPMIPLTMGFFLKRNKSRKGAVKEGVVYTLSILLIYVVLGTLLTLVFGVDFLNKLSTNAGVNLFFFALLILFGLSFMGLFEVNLPSSWVNFSDRKSGEKKGLFSIFFMAFTLFLVSFSCTAPIVGTLLVELVHSREILAPMIGMLGFALSLAIPFSLLALFPSLLTHLPKSGSGLKDIKFLLGVCEIAFSLKFFSVADGAYRWGILGRETFLWIWIVLSIFLMVYFLIKTYKNFLQKDSLGALVRFLASTLFFLLSFHLYNAILGNKLSPEIEAFLPPAKNQIKGTYYDYEEGMKQSKLIHKPVLLNFSGYGCVNCRKMERTILQDPEIREWIEKNLVFIQLYVDDRTSLPSSIQVEWEGKKRTLSTFGEKWSYIQSTQYKMNAQPYFVLLSYGGELLGEPCGFTSSKEEFKEFLVGGLEEMKNRGY